MEELIHDPAAPADSRAAQAFLPGGKSGSVRALLWRSRGCSAARATQSRQSKAAASCRSSQGERATRYEHVRRTQAR